jgi:hypothetical protein
MDDDRQLKNDLSSLISKVAHEFLPQLQFLHNKAAVNVIPENADDLGQKEIFVVVIVILYLFFNSFTFQPNFCRIHTPFFKAILIKQ